MHILFAFGIGVSSGLRTFTAPAVVCWAARLDYFSLYGTAFYFMESRIAVAIFTVMALFEYFYDLRPNVPNRTAPGSLIARIISGALSGACLFAAVHRSWIAGGLLGAVAAVIGAFAGYHARKSLVENLKVKDATIAIPEDLVAIALACAAVAF